MKELSEEERNRRIALDFNKTERDIRIALQEYYPELSDAQLRNWEQCGVLEYKDFDTERRYFRNAARNVLRIDPAAAALRVAREGEERAERAQMLAQYIPGVMRGDVPLLRRYHVKYRVTVAADAVPDGEVVRCWLPFPRRDVAAQCDVELLRSSPTDGVLSGDVTEHASLYLERVARSGESTVFEAEYAFSYAAQCVREWPESVGQFVTSGFEKELSEQLPHIVFTENLRALAQEITTGIPTAYGRAKALFTWISEHLPWASAREYSTIDCIPEYVIANRHGDCGQVSLLFITLCRICGVPARWQSGFMLHPGFENLHDWAEIYLVGLGWVPVDQSFGLQRRLLPESERYFYLGGMDGFRWVVNSGISGNFFPAKEHERSETIDFQRGEVEWRGGNLYFDSWDYSFEVTSLKDDC